MNLGIPLWIMGVLVPSGGALAAGFQWPAENAAWTEPAGVHAPTTFDSLVASEYFGIQALKVWDFDGRTCSLQLEQSSLNAPSARVLGAVRLCEPKRTQTWRRADVGSGQFVTAIAVCTAQARAQIDEIHGVQLWSAAIDATGKLKPAKESVKLEFAHCERWSPKRACPAGSLATGVRAYVAASDAGAVGLALRCHSIRASDE